MFLSFLKSFLSIFSQLYTSGLNCSVRHVTIQTHEAENHSLSKMISTSSKVEQITTTTPEISSPHTVRGLFDQAHVPIATKWPWQDREVDDTFTLHESTRG